MKAKSLENCSFSDRVLVCVTLAVLGDQRYAVLERERNTIPQQSVPCVSMLCYHVRYCALFELLVLTTAEISLLLVDFNDKLGK